MPSSLSDGGFVVREELYSSNNCATLALSIAQEGKTMPRRRAIGISRGPRSAASSIAPASQSCSAAAEASSALIGDRPANFLVARHSASTVPR